MDQQEPVPPSLELAHDELEAIVQRATQSHAAQVVSWQVNQLTGGRETVSRIYQVDVQAQVPTSRQLVRLPLILKRVGMTPERLASTHWNYWLREAEAYASHSLTRLPASLAAPQCYGINRSEDVVWIWLEHVEASSVAQWTEAEIGPVCYELGRFNGAYLTDNALPTGAWATRDWLRQYVATTATYIEQLPNLQQHPLVGRAVDSQLLPELLRFVEEREHWLSQLESLPQVFCHQDIHRGNLFLSSALASQLQMVAIDWSFAGIAALGQELASILFTNRHVPNIFALATQQYTAGLRAVGWQGDEATVWWSSASTTALNYGVAMVGLFIEQLLDEQKHAQLVDGFGSTIEHLPPRVNRWIEFGLNYANVARGITNAK